MTTSTVDPVRVVVVSGPIDWGAVAAVLALLALIAVVWQIVRFETSIPLYAWNFRTSTDPVVTNGMRQATCEIRLIGASVAYEARAVVRGAASEVTPSVRPMMDASSEPMTVELTATVDADPYVLVTHWRIAPISRRAITVAERVWPFTGEADQWCWYRLPGRRSRGRWVRRTERKRGRVALPVDAH